MKKFLNIITISVLCVLMACKSQLDTKNINQPTTESIQTEKGMKRTLAGIYGIYVSSDGATYNGGVLSDRLMWITYAIHGAMGDEIFIPWGNYGFRWANQVGKITLDNNTVITPPQGGTQRDELTNRNTRAFGDDNAVLAEWMACYFVNNVANLILENVDNCKFSGDPTLVADKRNASKAWARFWKGYAYSRIGSMYSAGLIANSSNQTTGVYVTNDAMIAEANAQFDQAIALLTPYATDPTNAGIADIMAAGIPDFVRAASTPSVPTAAMLIRNANSMKARNLMVNKKVATMSAGDWTTIQNLANNGVTSTDFVFSTVLDGTIILYSSVSLNATPFSGFHFVSERLIQDFKAGDARFDRNFVLLPASDWYVNIRGRGIQYGGRYDVVDGAPSVFSSTPGQARTYIGPTYEENQLMLGESKIRTGQIDQGLAHVDAVRTFQTSGLTAVSGTGLTSPQAIEELRKERRIGLLIRGLAFYDARRWGVIDPISAGGGRTGCRVIDSGSNLNTNATFEYNYLNYFAPPAGELDFNAPKAGSAPVTPR